MLVHCTLAIAGYSFAALSNRSHKRGARCVSSATGRHLLYFCIIAYSFGFCTEISRNSFSRLTLRMQTCTMKLPSGKRVSDLPSLKSKLVLGTLRTGKGFFSRVGDTLMQSVHIPDHVIAELPLGGLRSEALPVENIPALMLTPEGDYPEDCLILHCHGGAYVSGKLIQAKAIAALVCGAAQIRTVTFAYRLAPEYPYPAAVEDALTVWDTLMAQGFSPNRIVLVGESAGGNLCLALCQKLRAQHRTLPAALALLSPWADLQQTGASYEQLKDIDATLSAPGLMKSALDYAGGSPEKLADPMISPVLADFTDFPDTQIHVGTAELLLSDSELLAEAMRRDRVSVQLIRWEGMCHVFQMFGFPESRESLKAIGAFLRYKLHISPETEERSEKDGSV